MASYVETFASKLDWAMPFQRTGAFPLDRTDLFSSHADAVKYAAGNIEDPDSRALCGTSYVGQIITVYENDVVTVYKIAADRTLSEVGTATNGDDASIVLSDGLLSLYGFESATEGQQCRIKNIGSPEEPQLVLEWYTPDTSTVAGLQEAVGQLQSDVATINGDSGTVGSIDYKIAQNNANYYTKSEVDGKITGALHYKGTYDTFAALTAAVDEGSITPAVGDVYNIQTAGGTDSHGTAIKAGDNVICSNATPGAVTWDVSSGTVDLSAYYNKTQVDAALELKVDKVEGSRLMTNEEGTKLASLTKVGESSTNGNILIDDEEVTVYTAPTATNSAKGVVKGSADQDKVNVGADGTMTVNNISATKVQGAVSEATKTTNALSIGTKTFDGSSPVTLEASDVPLPDTVIHNTNIATEANVGVVKGSADQDKVNVGADGTMTVNNISATKVQGAVSEATKTTNALTFGSDSFDGSAPKEITAESIGALTDADLNGYVKNTNYATTTTGGVIKSTATGNNNKVTVAADGTASVDSVAGSTVNGAVATATNAAQLGGQNATDILETGSSKVKAATTADKLATARDITLSNDVTGTASFDGTGNVEIVATLKDVVTNGTYSKVTVDTKGRVTKGENLTAGDIPDLTLAKITDAGALAAKDQVAESDLDSALTSKLTGLTDNSHTHSNKTVIDGITSEQVGNWNNAVTTLPNKADKATTLAGYGIQDAYTKEEVNGMVGGAFHYKGTYNTLAELNAAISGGTITEVLVGDVYNIQTAGGTDSHGTAIKAGDNVVVQQVSGQTPDYDVEWDVLSGTVDLSAYYNKTQVDEALLKKANQSEVTTISGKVDTLESTVGNEGEGLVKKVNDNTTAIQQNTSNIATLSGVVGADSEHGLQKAVADNTAAITTLNAGAETPGSVKNLIAASASDITEAINAITEVGTGTIDTRIATHNTAADAHAELFATKQNKAIQASITFETTDFVANDAGNGPAYKATKLVVGLDTGRDYSPAISPTITSCPAVIAAQFYPVAEVDAGQLTVYCVNAPTTAIVLNGTFTEIQ